MRPKRMKTIATIIAITIAMGIAALPLDKRDRLAHAALAETRSGESQDNRLRLAEVTAVNSYPQDIHNDPNLWKSAVRQQTVSRYGNRKQWICINELIQRESGWRLKANNPQSTAFGLFQLLKLNPKAKLHKQIRHGLRYIQHRYETPCKALQHHNKHGWY